VIRRIIQILAMFKVTVISLGFVGLFIMTIKYLGAFLMIVHMLFLLPESQPQGINLLIVGTDNVEGSKRSDVISVVHINPDQTQLNVLAIPRDTRVAIPGYGISKINHAYAYGGITLLKQTISEFLSIPIDDYVVVNEQGVIAIIDALGGVPVTIDADMAYDDHAGNLHIHFKKGDHTLTGQDLVHYLRFRNDSQGDIGRIARQQQVMRQLMKTVGRLDTVWMTPTIIRMMANSVQTDLSFKQITRWVTIFYQNWQSMTIQFNTVPGSIRLIDGVSYWRPNMVYLDSVISQTFTDYHDTVADNRRFSPNQIKRISQHIQLDDAQDIAQKSPITIEVLNGNGVAGLAIKTADFLKSLQLNVVKIDNSESFDYDTTLIVDWKGNIEKSLRLATMLGIDPANIVVYDRPEKPLDVTLVLGKNWSEAYMSRIVEP
jgi:LCP family protein required for cell wall assembly